MGTLPQTTALGAFLEVPDTSRPQILSLVHRVPYPPDKGDRIRAYHLLRYLAQRADVHLACFADEPVTDEAAAVLNRLCRRVAILPVGKTRWLKALISLLGGKSVTVGAFRCSGLRSTLRQWAADVRFDYCLASSSALVPYLQLPELRPIRAVIDLIDVDSEKWAQYAAAGRGWRSWLHHLEARRLRRLEESIPCWAHAVTLVSPAEVELYRAFCRPGSIHAITNGVDLEYFHPAPAADGKCCVFVGALDYPPNIDGVCWFSQHVWPDILRRQPQARLLLVGRNPVPSVCDLAGIAGVEIVGAVPDVRPYVARAAVAVAPLRIARGVQNKILEALAMGRAVVASPAPLTGLRAQPGLDLLRAQTASEWVDAVVRLLDDADLRRQLGQAGRRYVEAHHHWDQCLKPFGALFGLTSAIGQFDSVPAVTEDCNLMSSTA